MEKISVISSNRMGTGGHYIKSKKPDSELGMTLSAFNAITLETRKEELCEFKANLFCIVSFRVARVTYRDHVLIQTNKRIQTQKHKQHLFPPTG